VFLIRFLLRLALGLVILVVVALVVGNFWARAHAQHVMAQRIRSSTGAEHVSVHISSFPFLYELAVSKIDRVKVIADGVPAGPIRLTHVTVDARDVEVDHHFLIFDRKLRIVSIARATVTVQIEQKELAAIADAVNANLTVVDGHQLVVSIFGHRVLSIDLTKSRLVPNCTLALLRVSSGFSASCTVAPVPPSLLATLNARAALAA
jgi:hypothetical protein